MPVRTDQRRAHPHPVGVDLGQWPLVDDDVRRGAVGVPGAGEVEQDVTARTQQVEQAPPPASCRFGARRPVSG